MANEINLITCIEEVTKRQIVMKGTTYVYFDTKENVEDSVIEDATALKTKKEAEQEKADIKTNGEIYTLNGVDYKIPFMKDDADGVVQVTLGFMKSAFEQTTIVFSNGVELPIKATEFDDFATWFAEKRNSFFV
jgi:hypothetical protein